MRLPGGLCEAGARHRDCVFRPVDGHLELAVSGEGDDAANVPERVTRVLARALATIGGKPATPDRVARLSVADRQHLARGLAARLGRDEVWLTSECADCAEPFDVRVRQSELPVEEAGDGYPFVEVERSDGRCRLRVPDGRDQVALAALESDAEAAWTLVERCFVEGEGEWSEPRRDECWLGAVDEAFEQGAPQVVLEVGTRCPQCGSRNRVPVDAYLGLRERADVLFDDVHALASNYHWSEEQILALPLDRRGLYLRLIDRDRGVSR